MRLDDSDNLNVEDQRGGNFSSAGFGGGGGLGLLGMLVPFVFSRFGCGGVVVLGIAVFLFGGLGSIGFARQPIGDDGSAPADGRHIGRAKLPG